MADGKDKGNDLLFDVRRSVRYHMRRRRFYEGRNRLTNALASILGSAAVVAFLSKFGQDYGTLMAILTAFIAVFAAIDLASSTAAMARLHSDLARKFIDLEQSLVLMSDPGEVELREAQATRLKIEADEPPIYRILDTLCYNEMFIAYGYDRSELFIVPWYKRIAAHFMDFGYQSIRNSKPSVSNTSSVSSASTPVHQSG